MKTWAYLKFLMSSDFACDIMLPRKNMRLWYPLYCHSHSCPSLHALFPPSPTLAKTYFLSEELFYSSMQTLFSVINRTLAFIMRMTFFCSKINMWNVLFIMYVPTDKWFHLVRIWFYHLKQSAFWNLPKHVHILLFSCFSES